MSINRTPLASADLMELMQVSPWRLYVPRKAYQAMEKFVEEGKIRSVGLSNWYVKELEEFLPQVTIPPAG